MQLRASTQTTLYGKDMNGSASSKLTKIIETWRKRRKGQFVVYTREGKRFAVPLYYLNHPIFRVLLEMAEEEYGLTVDGPLQVPCEKELMDYILCLLRKHPPLEVEKALLSVTCRGALTFPLLPLIQAQHQGVTGTTLLSSG